MLRKTRLFSALSFLLLIFAGLIAISYHAVQNIDKFIEEKLSFNTLVDGRFTSAIDRHIDEILPASKTINSFIDGMLYWTIGDTGPQVRAGCDGWLFLAEELREIPNGETYLAQRVKLAEKIAKQLKQHGTKLIVVPVPDKAALAQEQLCGIRVSQQAQHRKQQWDEMSASLELNQVDISSDWPHPGYWRTDTHWDQQGAHHAARLIGQEVELKLGSGEQKIQLDVLTQDKERGGDLTKLAGLTETLSLFSPAPDIEKPVSVAIERSGGLLDDTPVPAVVLAGSSYSLNSYFHEYLQAETSQEIVQKSMAGGGFAGAILDLIETNPQIFDQVKLIIWEWPERVLTQPLSAQEKIFISDM